MKKLLLLTALLLTGLSVSAQGLKGTWFAGGQLSFGSDKTHLSSGLEQKVTNTTVLPILGTFVSPTVAVGAGVGYMGGKTKIDGKDDLKSNNFVFKPLARKYWNISGGLFFFGQAALPVIFSDSKKYVDNTEYKTTGNSFSLELSPGFDYVINGWITVETSFSILNTGYSSSKPKNGKRDSSFSFNANPFNSVDDRVVGNLQIGVKFLF